MKEPERKPSEIVRGMINQRKGDLSALQLGRVCTRELEMLVSSCEETEGKLSTWIDLAYTSQEELEASNQTIMAYRKTIESFGVENVIEIEQSFESSAQINAFIEDLKKEYERTKSKEGNTKMKIKKENAAFLEEFNRRNKSILEQDQAAPSSSTGWNAHSPDAQAELAESLGAWWACHEAQRDLIDQANREKGSVDANQELFIRKAQILQALSPFARELLDSSGRISIDGVQFEYRPATERFDFAQLRAWSCLDLRSK